MTAHQPIVHVVGARPNFIKSAPVIADLRARGIDQRLVHTGQHYDDAMSAIFFRDLDLPNADLDLGVGSGTQAGQTAALMVALEGAIEGLRPTAVVVYGDINSTLATALVAAKLGIRLAHVEAGLRSFDRSMPEEINRVVTDQLSDLLFVTSPEGLDNLVREGVPGEAIFVGNPMIDTLMANLERFDPAAGRARFGLIGDYAVATVHRPANVDDPEAAARIVAALRAVGELMPVVIPLHPRGRAMLEAAGLGTVDRVIVVEPLGYIEFLGLVRGARVAITDSGGIQEETTILGIPCLTMRPNTERPITISQGTNRLVEPAELATAVRAIVGGRADAPSQPPPLWDGHAGERIGAILAARYGPPAGRG
jgi:UDP-N-acetylglucosamine 2-epimerase (non-hydrolysing)